MPEVKKNPVETNVYGRSKLAVAGLVFAACAFLALNVPVLISLVERWLRAGFEHGYPIALMSLALVVMRFRNGEVKVGQPSRAALIPLGLCLLVQLLGHAATVTILPELVFPICVLAVVALLFGWRAARPLAPAMLFLYFAIPFWQLFALVLGDLPSLNEGLRSLTTQVTSWVVWLAGVPAYVDGDFIHLPPGTFEIAEGCSGRAFFIVALELACFYSLAYLHSWSGRIRLAAAATGLALLGNWIRVSALIFIGYFTEMRSSLVEEHEVFGWVVFVGVMFPLALIARRIEFGEKIPGKQPDASDAGGRSAGTAVIVTGALVLVTAAAANLAVAAMYARDSLSDPIDLPDAVGWRQAGEWTGTSRPVFRQPSAEAAARYSSAGEDVSVYVANYAVQKQGREAIFFANLPAGEDGFVMSRGSASVTAENGRLYSFEELHVATDADRRLVWYGVFVAGQDSRGQASAKLNQIRGVLKGRVDAQVLVMSAACRQANCETAQATLSEFGRATIPGFYSAAYAPSSSNRD